MYRIYLYLIWDGRKVARIEVDAHRARVHFPEIFEPLIPSTRLELITVAEMDETDIEPSSSRVGRFHIVGSEE